MKQYLLEVNLYKLLAHLEQELLPVMAPYGHHAEVNPTDLMLGLSGRRSNFLPMFRKVAEEEQISLLRLIADVSVIDRKAPPEELLWKVIASLE